MRRPYTRRDVPRAGRAPGRRAFRGSGSAPTSSRAFRARPTTTSPATLALRRHVAVLVPARRSRTPRARAPRRRAARASVDSRGRSPAQRAGCASLGRAKSLRVPPRAGRAGRGRRWCWRRGTGAPAISPGSRATTSRSPSPGRDELDAAGCAIRVTASTDAGDRRAVRGRGRRGMSAEPAHRRHRRQRPLRARGARPTSRWQTVAHAVRRSVRRVLRRPARRTGG